MQSILPGVNREWLRSTSF